MNSGGNSAGLSRLGLPGLMIGVLRKDPVPPETQCLRVADISVGLRGGYAPQTRGTSTASICQWSSIAGPRGGGHVKMWPTESSIVLGG
jgi:hypothetical protein